MNAPQYQPRRARPARRDRPAAPRAQRGHPRPLLPGARNPGPGRFRRRQPRSVAQGGRRPTPTSSLSAASASWPRPRRSCRPDKIVVLPDMAAGCSLEDSCPPDKFKAFREAHPDHIALTYINCSAEVKALSDIIVTSSSAETILAQIPKDQKIIFGPDKHLGGYLARKTGRDMLLWPGVCIVHEAFSETELLKLKAQHPGAPVARPSRMPAAHPRPCRLCRLDLGILNFALKSPSETIIVATEPHIIHQMEKAAPHKTFIGAPGRGRQLQLQHVPLHGAQHDREALPRAARPRSRGSRSRRGCGSPPRSRSTGCSKWPRNTVGKGDVGRPVFCGTEAPPRTGRSITSASSPAAR